MSEKFYKIRKKSVVKINQKLVKMNCMSVQQEKNYNSSSSSSNNNNSNSQYHHKNKRNTSTHNTREFQSQTSRVGGFRSCLRGEIEEAESKSTIPCIIPCLKKQSYFYNTTSKHEFPSTETNNRH